MVRRIMALFLLVPLILLTGCHVEMQNESGESVRFYYLVTDARLETGEGPADWELFDIQGHETDYEWILANYFAGPSTEGLTAPFPKTTSLISVEVLDGVAYVNASKELAQLTGIDVTIACSCITMTCLQLEGIESVVIRADGWDLNGRHMVSMNADSLILEDGSDNINTQTYMLYFSNTDNRYLIAEELLLDTPREKLPEYLLNRLIAGPGETGLAHTVPSGTKVQKLEVFEGICNVDFSGEFLADAPKTELAQRMTILSITNTLTQLEEIQQLVIYVDGTRLERYGFMDLSLPLSFEAGAIGPARISLNELDADLFLCVGQEGNLLFRLPTRVRQTAEKASVELILDALLECVPQNGYHNPIPSGTRLLSVRTEGDICTVELSEEFLVDGQPPAMAVRAICATVVNAEDCDAVQIVVAPGEQDETPLVLELLTPDPSWYAAR